MAEDVTLREVMAQPAPVPLSCGGQVEIRKVRLPNLAAATNLYGSLLQVLTAQFGRKPTDEDLAVRLPAILATMIAQRDKGLCELLSYVSGATTYAAPAEDGGEPAAEWLLPDDIDLGDVERLWAAISRANRGPFELCLSNIDARMVELLLAAASGNVSSSPDSSPQE